MPLVNTNNDTTKKPVSDTDWHKADIKCALEKRGYTFVKLSRLNGLAENAVQMVLHTPWPNAQKIVADAIGVTPQQIWPSRYDEDGTPKRGLRSRLIHRQASRPSSNHSTAAVSNGSRSAKRKAA